MMGGGKQQDGKKEAETKGIIQFHLAGSESDSNDKKSSVSVDTGDSESLSLVMGGNSELGYLDDTASTQHHVGVLCGYDDNIYIPTLAEVFDSVDQDHLSSCDDDDDDDELIVYNDMPAFLGMVLSENEDFANDSDNESKSISFNVTNPKDIFNSALFWLAIAKTSLETAAESWFEAVDVKFEICNLQNATTHQGIFTSSGSWEINARFSANNCQTMYTEALGMLNQLIIGIHLGISTPKPVHFSGLPVDEEPPTDLIDDEQDCYTLLITSAVKMQQQRLYHWANRNLEKARRIRLASWYYMGLWVYQHYMRHHYVSLNICFKKDCLIVTVSIFF